MNIFDGALQPRRDFQRMAAMLLALMAMASTPAPVRAGDMKVWIGKYPDATFQSDIVRGTSFLDSPEVKTGIAETLGLSAFSQIKTMGVISPIVGQGEWVIANGCYPHRCNEGDWTIAINSNTLEMRACLALVDSLNIRFGATGKRYIDLVRSDDGLCPQGDQAVHVFDEVFGPAIASRPPTVPSPTSPSSAAPNVDQSLRTIVALKEEGGTFVVPTTINGALTLDFIIDSGAADVSVPADVFSTLIRTGTIKDSDITGQQTYVLADGSKTQSYTFIIRSLKVGEKVIGNVKGSVASASGSLLLGQSFLERFRSWSIDNTQHELVLGPE